MNGTRTYDYISVMTEKKIKKYKSDFNFFLFY